MANKKEDTNGLVSGIDNPAYHIANDLPVYSEQNSYPARQNQAGAAYSGTKSHAQQLYITHPYPNSPHSGHQAESSCSTVVVTQQATNVAFVSRVIFDNMGLSFFACLCCFWPLGLVAIYKSSQTQNALARGDFDGAARNSREARILSFISIGVGVVLIIIGIVLAVTLPMRQSYYYGDSRSSY